MMLGRSQSGRKRPCHRRAVSAEVNERVNSFAISDGSESQNTGGHGGADVDVVARTVPVEQDKVRSRAASQPMFFDLQRACGVPAGHVPSIVQRKIVVAANPQYLAGSAQLTDACVAHAIRAAGLSLHDAWNMASRNTARALKVEEHRLARGSRADLVLFNWSGPGHEIRIRTTVAAGELRYGLVGCLGL